MSADVVRKRPNLYVHDFTHGDLASRTPKLSSHCPLEMLLGRGEQLPSDEKHDSLYDTRAPCVLFSGEGNELARNDLVFLRHQGSVVELAQRQV